MTFTSDDLKPLLQYFVPILGGLWFVIKLVFSSWQKVETQKHVSLIKDQVNLKDAMTELKQTVATMAQVQSQTIKELGALKDLSQGARLEMKDHRIETVRANDESRELFRRWVPIMKKVIETQVTQVGENAFLVRDKKKP